MKSENADIIAKYNGKNEIFGIINAPEYKDKFEALIKPITKAHIDSCIQKYFKKEGMVISIVSSKSWTEKQLNIHATRLFS